MESLKHIWFQEATLGIPEAKKVRTEMSAFKTILQRDVRPIQLKFLAVKKFCQIPPDLSKNHFLLLKFLFFPKSEK